MSHDPDDEQLRVTFDGEFARALAGEGVRNHRGLDYETFRALARVAGAYPDVAPALIEAAHAAFAGQLDGSNAENHSLLFADGEAERIAAETESP
ncbi:hypothetical protein ACFWF7_16380 [Nocardia sp. NPDC060256]|uniref:hypothetical protein n=1 Tax=unclassified Nocardia TaxID=2637762 RepID=UPI00365F6049